MAQRSRARSIGASAPTGYCGAVRTIVASIPSRWARTLPTRPRASSAARGSPSVSARWRSRIASAGRWPKSASKIAARASRRPARSARIRSEPALAPDAIDRHGDRHDPQVEQALDGRRHRVADLAGEGRQGLTWTGDDPDPDANAV